MKTSTQDTSAQDILLECADALTLCVKSHCLGDTAGEHCFVIIESQLSQITNDSIVTIAPDRICQMEDLSKSHYNIIIVNGL